MFPIVPDSIAKLLWNCLPNGNPKDVAKQGFLAIGPLGLTSFHLSTSKPH